MNPSDDVKSDILPSTSANQTMTTLTKADIDLCHHRRGRMIFNTASALLVALIIGIFFLLLGVRDIKQELRSTLAEIELFTLGTAVEARELEVEMGKPLTLDDILNEAGAELDEMLVGVWSFPPESTIKQLTLHGDGKATMSPSQPSRKILSWSTRDNLLVLESVIQGNDVDGAQTLTSVVLPVERVFSDELTLQFGNKPYTAQRDYEASKPEIYTMQFKDSFYNSIVEKADVIIYAFGIVGLGLFLWTLFLLTYYQTFSDAIRVTPEQFPRSYAIFEELAYRIGLEKTPEFYLKNGNGVYNAYASCVPGYRNYACIYAEILHTFELGGDETVFRTVMAHELGHIRLGHVTLWKNVLRMVFSYIPGLNYVMEACGRSFEYEADQMALHFVKGEEAAKSMLVLLSSAFLYQKVNVTDYRKTTKAYPRLGLIINNFTASHPVMPWRIDALCNHCQGGLFTHHIQEGETPESIKRRNRFAVYRESQSLDAHAT